MNRNNQNYEHGISMIDAEYGQSGTASIYLLEQAGQVAIIETGTNHSVPYVEEVLLSKGLSFDDVAYVIPTHVHLDHAGGAGEFINRCKNSMLIVHPFGAAHLIDPSKLIAGTMAVYGEEKFKKLYGDIRPIDASRVIEAPGFFSLDFNGRELQFYDTPGHARHHFCIFDKQSKSIFTGDTFGIAYPQLTTNQGRLIFATTTPVQFDPGSLLQSIECLMSLKPKTMYLTHFGPISPTPEVVEQLKRSIRKFANIALDAQDAISDTNKIRTDYIEQQLQNYLLNTIEKMGAEHPRAFYQEMIEFDCKLNAQGLAFWINKNA
jgi:glyoxylase-like metal-dependent hydrolase (beta-lactamase superfamily II)